MALFIKTHDGLKVNDSCFEEQRIVEKFFVIAERNGFDNRVITYGVFPSPDFGYFDLADRFWRASLCIYLSGGIGCFWESGIGFTEPWLFNARHSFELILKGFLLFSVWLEKVKNETLSSGDITEIETLKEYFKSPHSLLEIYNNYQSRVKKVIENWKSKILDNPPELDRLTLKTDCEYILNELNELDTKSFTFRYPSLKKGSIDVIQKADWKHDASKLYPNTGLPKESGYFFDHIKSINSLHDLNTDLTNIRNYFNSISDYIGEMQDYIYE